jgi:hypothetical protein
MPIPISTGDLAATAVDRRPLGEGGASGATLERLEFADGRVLILKSFSAGRDWMMRATHDSGRAAELWVSGTADRLPASIDAAIERIEREGDEWRLYLRDVSAAFLRAGSRVSMAEVRRFLDAVAAMHEAFWHLPVAGLTTIEDLLLLASPATVAREAGDDSHFLGILDTGWSAFHDAAPTDIGAAVQRILDDPRPLADALRAGGTTLVHADLHYGNVAPAADRFHVIDWGLATAAPPAVDVAWYLDQSLRFIDGTADDVLAEFAAAEGPRHDDRTLRLALLAELVLAAWQHGHAIRADDAAARAAARTSLDWWVARARDGLELLG